MKKRAFHRRRRVKWDMQTFRDCERDVPIDLTSDIVQATCSAPQIFADLLCGPIASSDTPMIAGASRALMYGGGHLKYRYDVAPVASSNQPCSFNFKVVTALVVLPLLEDDLSPAYLPNLLVSRTQLSVVHATQSDNDENILYWDDANLIAYNMSCSGLEGDCVPNPGCSSSTESELRADGWLQHATALYGRREVETRVRVRRKLREREALFLLTEYAIPLGLQGSVGAQIDHPVRRTVYHRYAVHVSR